MSPIGKVEAVNVSAQDVGEEYVDLEAQVANRRRLEARLLELLDTRTGDLEDVLDRCLALCQPSFHARLIGQR